MSPETQEIIITRTIAAPAARLYAAFTSAAGWCTWCCEQAEVEAQIGGNLHIYTDGYNAYGKFTILEENQAVAFTWDGDKEPPSWIHVWIEPQADQTLLTFKVIAENPAGWTGPEEKWNCFAEFLEYIWGHTLDNLKFVLETKPG